MKHLTARALAAAFLLVLGGSPARADLAEFSYSWTVSPGAVLTSGTGSVDFALASAGSASVTIGSLTPAGIPAATVTTTSSAVDTPDVFNQTFGLTLHLTDTPSGQSGQLTFGGTVAGTLTATGSALVVTFDAPGAGLLTLGGRVYLVTIGPTTATLPAPGAASPTLLDALVTAALDVPPTVPPPTRHDSPEPASVVLAGSALLLLGLARRRLR